MTLGESINKLYAKVTYIDNYGIDIIIAIIILYIFSCGNLWFYIKNNLQHLKTEWKDPSGNIRCDPLYLPFAAVINPPPIGTSDLEFITNNIKYCTTKTLKAVSIQSTSPLKEVLDGLIDTLKDIADIIVGLISFLNMFVKSIENLLSNMVTNMSSYLSNLESLFGSIVSIFTTATTINMVLMYVIQGFVDVIMSLIPTSSSCFDKDTKISMYDGSYKTIDNIKVGERLLYDGVVTTTFKLSAFNIPMYTYNGVIVSGSHYVYIDNKLKKIEDIPQAKKIPNYLHKHIYCINTTSKQISIKNNIFADYDDLTKEDCTNLLTFIKYKFMKDKSVKMDTYDIHRYLNSGLQDVKIQLHNGAYKLLSSIVVGDVLKDNIKVTGVVEILPDVKIKNITLNDKTLVGGPNIQIMDKNSGICFNVMDRKEKSYHTKYKLYHLITDKGGFFVNNVYIGDYSVGMNILFKEELSHVLTRI